MADKIVINCGTGSAKTQKLSADEVAQKNTDEAVGDTTAEHPLNIPKLNPAGATLLDVVGTVNSVIDALKGKGA